MEYKYTVSLVLGLIGSIFGLLSTVGVMMFGSLGVSLGATASGNEIISLGVVAFLISVIALIFSCLVHKHNKVSGSILIICAVSGFICSFMAYIVPGILLIVAGGLALLKKNTVKVRSN